MAGSKRWNAESERSKNLFKQLNSAHVEHTIAINRVNYIQVVETKWSQPHVRTKSRDPLGIHAGMLI